MRVIITGGTGLIGRALAASLASDGHEVVVLTRHPQHVSGLPAGARAERWDGATLAGWGHLADGAGAIVNLAGENLGASRWSAERKRRILSSRVNAGQAVLAAVRSAERKPAVLIQSSAVGYYGPRGDEIITERSAPGTDFMAQVAVQWEASTEPVESLGVRRAIIRSGVVLSMAGGALPRLVQPFHFFVGGRLGSGKQWFSWMHIDDEVRAIRFLIDDAQASGPYNLTAPDPVTNATLARTVGHVLGRPALFPVPAFVLRLLFGEMATTVLDGQRVAPERLAGLDFAFRYPVLEPALRDLLR